MRDLIGADNVVAAYRVQSLLTDERTTAGHRVVGQKVGLTSPAVQAQLGVDEPDFGILFDDMNVPSDQPIDLNQLLQPRIEAEIAFVLADDITNPRITTRSVRPFVAYACAALEIVDSRIANWDISLADTIADNASSGRFTLGPDKRRVETLEPPQVEMVMTNNDRTVSSGSGDACLGDPLNALVWLARTAIGNGAPLRAGQIVLSGALGPMVPVTQPATFEAHLTGLGLVRAAFTMEDTWEHAPR